MKELIARAKANPGKLNYGAGIITTRLAGYLFNREAGHRACSTFRSTAARRRCRACSPAAVDYIVDGAATSLPLIQEWQVARARQAQQPAAARIA